MFSTLSSFTHRKHPSGRRQLISSRISTLGGSGRFVDVHRPVMIRVFSWHPFLPYFDHPVNLESLFDPGLRTAFEFATEPQSFVAPPHPNGWDGQSATSGGGYRGHTQPYLCKGP